MMVMVIMSTGAAIVVISSVGANNDCDVWRKLLIVGSELGIRSWLAGIGWSSSNLKKWTKTA